MAHILVIDDEPMIRSLIRRILSSQNHVIREASNGMEGLDLIEQYHFDLIITDVLMPQLGGLGFISKVRKVRPCARIIIVTACSEGHEFNRLLEKKIISRIFYKPFDISIFQRSISELLAS